MIPQGPDHAKSGNFGKLMRPGGLDAMTIMAFSLNLDPAYVGAHQMARYIGLALLMPTATAYVLRRIGVPVVAGTEGW